MNISEWIKEQRKLLDAATPRPWVNEFHEGEYLISGTTEGKTHFTAIARHKGNAQLIAQAPTSLEKALAIIEIYDKVTKGFSGRDGYENINEARAKAAQIVGGEG